MDNFIVKDEIRSIPLNEYLDSIEEPLRRKSIVSLFESALPVLELMHTNFSFTMDVPQIYVRTSDEIQAAASSFGFIVIFQGVIDLCLGTACRQSKAILGDNDHWDNARNLIPTVGLAWVLAHEFTHLFRAHNEAEKEAGTHVNAAQALEHDADLCAAAAVYRSAQRWLSGTSDVDIRRYVIHALFWMFRPFPLTNDGAGVHPAPAKRFLQIIFKLATMGVKSSEIPDVNAKLPITASRAKSLFEVAEACEKVYQAENPGSTSNYLTQWAEDISNNKHLSIVKDWTKLSPLVEKHSSTNADLQLHASSASITAVDIARIEKAAHKRERKAHARAKRMTSAP